MRHQRHKRDWEIKTLVRSKLGGYLREIHGGMGLQKPEFDRRTRWLIVKTKDTPLVKFGDSPSGIVFNDGSFLTIAERWSEEGELLSFS